MLKRDMRCSVTIIFAAMLISLRLFSQAPSLIPFQAVARDFKGELIINKKISCRLTIRDGAANGTIIYREVHRVSTNTFGTYNVTIGQGQAISGKMDMIQWGAGNKFEQIEIDPDGGSSVGVKEIGSVSGHDIRFSDSIISQNHDLHAVFILPFLAQLVYLLHLHRFCLRYFERCLNDVEIFFNFFIYCQNA